MNHKEPTKLKLQRAQKRVQDLKGFYQHVLIYIIVNTLLFIFSERVTFILLSKKALGDPEFLEWVNWNVWGTPIIWSFALLIHAITVFLKNPFKKWEEQQIQKMLDKDN